jgi:flagellar biosynthetic protein FliQ
VPFSLLLPAFVTSELKTAFQIGFLLLIPFLIIDLVVASVLMSMGMVMLSPLIISLPFKIMLFVLVDGWSLVMTHAGRQLLSPDDRALLRHGSFMSPEDVLQVGNQAMWMAILLAAPILLTALVIGLVIGMVQAATQIQEMTLSFIPKLLGIVGVLVIAGPWMLTMMIDWMRELMLDIPLLIG